MTSTSASSSFGRIDGVPTREILEGLARLHQLVLVVDDQGCVAWVSDALAPLCGGQQIIGRKLLDLFVEWREGRSADDTPRWTDAIASQIAAIDEHLRHHDTLSDFRLKLGMRDGESLGVDVNAFRVKAADAQSALVVVVVRPVRERERVGRELSEARSDVKAAILDAAPDAVVVIDDAGFITYANPAVESLLGIEPEELLHKPVALYLPRTATFGRLASSLDPDRDLLDAEFELSGPRGEEVWISVTTRTLCDADGDCGRTVAFLRNVTERKRAEQALERKNADLETCLHSVSHDLRGPLVSLLGFSRLLRQDYDEILEDTGRHFLDRIEQAGRTMEALIHDLLELSRVGESAGQRSRVDPRPVLLQLRAELKPRLDSQGIELELPSSPPLLSCDPTRLYQVFSNLVGNAVNHMGRPPEPRITVDVREEGNQHHITVRDNGKGIPHADQERIFEAFQTLQGTSDGPESAGIGLAIVKKIAESYEGRVWVESAPGRGSAFHLTLPRR